LALPAVLFLSCNNSSLDGNISFPVCRFHYPMIKFRNNFWTSHFTISPQGLNFADMDQQINALKITFGQSLSDFLESND